jgi:hypothetical protein
VATLSVRPLGAPLLRVAALWMAALWMAALWMAALRMAALRIASALRVSAPPCFLPCLLFLSLSLRATYTAA